MKTLHKIQNVIAFVALTMATYLATQIEMTRNKTISCLIMIILTVLMLLERKAKAIHHNE